MRIVLLAAVLAICACGPTTQAEGIPEYGYQIVNTYPHDPLAFTQGLVYLNGFLYEGTGQNSKSSIRKVKFETGEVLQRRDLHDAYFGEGIVNWKDKLIQVTYQTEVGFVYDLNTFAVLREFKYPGEGWGLTTDGKRIVMSDGTAELRIWNPDTLQEIGRIAVTDQGVPVHRLNELEWVKGEIYANIWETDRIARIDPKTGHVVGWIDLTGLLTPAERERTDVLNGIAYDAARDRLFVTGKNWPKLFEIKLVKKGR